MASSGNIGSLLTNWIAGDLQAGMYSVQGRSAYAQALGQTNTLSSRANAANRQAKRDTSAALRNMVTMRSNQVRDMAAAQQHYYSSMAKATRTGMWFSAASDLLGMGASGWASYNSAKAYNAANQSTFDAYNQKYAAEIKAGTMQPMTGVSTGGAFLAGGLSGINTFTGMGGGQDAILGVLGMTEQQRRQLAGYGR